MSSCFLRKILANLETLPDIPHEKINVTSSDCYVTSDYAVSSSSILAIWLDQSTIESRGSPILKKDICFPHTMAFFQSIGNPNSEFFLESFILTRSGCR